MLKQYHDQNITYLTYLDVIINLCFIKYYFYCHYTLITYTSKTLFNTIQRSLNVKFKRYLQFFFFNFYALNNENSSENSNI